MKAVAQRWIFGLVSLVWVFAQVAAQTPAAQTPAAQAPAAAASFTKEQLEQIVAPMALYPDPLVSQMLMASTYPLEIVEAARWLKANPGLKDKALEEGLKTQDWDASVKSLCGFPDVIKQMDENLDWTQDLGDAFLAQKTELMDTLQRMRGKAYDAGQLKTTEQQVVTQQPDKIIVIRARRSRGHLRSDLLADGRLRRLVLSVLLLPADVLPAAVRLRRDGIHRGRGVGRGDLGWLQLGLGWQ